MVPGCAAEYELSLHLGTYEADAETPVRVAIQDKRTAGSYLPLELERRYRARDDFERDYYSA